MGRYHVYIMTNANRDRLYVGVTHNVWKRRSEHRRAGSETYAGQHGISDVIYIEEFQQVEEAISREKQLKALGRQQKLAIIKQRNPELISLESPSERYRSSSVSDLTASILKELLDEREE